MMPFDGGLDALPNGTLLLSIVAAVLYLLTLGRPPSWRRTVVKTAAAGLLAVLAAIEGGPALLVVALALSAAGDAFLAQGGLAQGSLSQEGLAQEGERHFLGGLACFLLAHIVYTALFLSAGGGLEIMLAQLWRPALAVVVLVLAGVLLRLLLPAAGPALRVPVAAYALAILVMTLAAATVPSPLVVIGAALFVVSDALLAIDRFLTPPAARGAGGRLGVQIWLFYYVAQLTIALGFLL